MKTCKNCGQEYSHDDLADLCEKHHDLIAVRSGRHKNMPLICKLPYDVRMMAYHFYTSCTIKELSNLQLDVLLSGARPDEKKLKLLNVDLDGWFKALETALMEKQGKGEATHA